MLQQSIQDDISLSASFGIGPLQSRPRWQVRHGNRVVFSSSTGGAKGEFSLYMNVEQSPVLLGRRQHSCWVKWVSKHLTMLTEKGPITWQMLLDVVERMHCGGFWRSHRTK